MEVMEVSIKADLGCQNGRTFFRIMRAFGQPYSDAREDENVTVRLPAFLEPVARRVLALRMDIDDAGYRAFICHTEKIIEGVTGGDDIPSAQSGR